MIGKTLLIVNPRSGKAAAKNSLLEIITTLSDAGCLVTVLPTKPGDFTVQQVKKLSPEYDFVIACGGDGTLNSVVEGVLGAEKHVPIGYIPLGSTNDFAISMGIPAKFRTATDMILQGYPVLHDVGVFNGRHFTYIAACGMFVEASYTTSQSLKNILGHSAYLMNALPSLADLQSVWLKVEVGDESFEGDYALCAFTNSTSAAGIIKFDGKQVNFSDGLFELVLIQKPTNLVETNRIATKLLTGNMNDPLIIVRHTNQCHITSVDAFGWSLDGENGGKHTEIFLSVEKNAISILK